MEKTKNYLWLKLLLFVVLLSCKWVASDLLTNYVFKNNISHSELFPERVKYQAQRHNGLLETWHTSRVRGSRSCCKNKDHQRMMVDPMFMIA